MFSRIERNPGIPFDARKGGGELTADAVVTSRGIISREVIGAGPDLLLLHSLLTDRDAFDPIIPALSAHWRVHKIDLPGFGHSSPCEPAIDSVLIGCGTGFGEAGQMFDVMAGKVAAGGMEAVVDIALRRIFTDDYLADHLVEASQRREVLLRTDPEAFTVACRALQTVDYTAWVSQVRNPTLIVTGSEDQATPPPMGQGLAELMPVAFFHLLSGLAHAPQLQDPEALLGVVRSFLDLGDAAIASTSN